MMGGHRALEAAMLAGEPLPLPVIDIHGHVGIFAPFHIPSPDGAGMLRVMDATGVAVTAVSSHSAFSADAALGNDYTAREVRAFPGRFLGYAVANPNYPATVEDELKRSFDELGFRMIKVHPSVHQCRLTDKRYEAVYRFAEKRGAPILTHTWEKDPHCSPEIAAEAASRHPEVTFIWGHAGATSFDEALDLAADLPRVYVDLACSQVFCGQVEYFLKRIGVEKVLFASDFCFISLPQQLAKVVFSRVPEGDKRRILHDNAAGILAEAGIEAP